MKVNTVNPNTVNPNTVNIRVKPYAYFAQKSRVEMLKMLSDLSLSKTRIAQIKNVSLPSIIQFHRRLTKDGLITEKRELTEGGVNTVNNFVVVSDDVNPNTVNPHTKTDLIRLHDLQFKVKILHKQEGYDYRENRVISTKVRDYKIIKLKNNYQEDFFINEVRIRTTTESILIMPSDIYTNTEQEAVAQAMKILFDTLPKIENLLNITLIKENYCNITVTRQHYALINNELAKMYRKEENKFKVLDKDGATRLIIDFSMNIPEFEAVHKTKSPSDINNCQVYFKDLISNEHLIPSKVVDIIVLTQTQLFEQGKALVGIMKLLNPQQEMSELKSKEKPDYFG